MRIWLFSFQINELPKPSYMHKTLEELRLGTYDNIETADEDTSIITALHKFIDRRVSALPLVDSEGRLVDIYAKFDVIVSADLILTPSHLSNRASSFHLSRIWQQRRPTMTWMCLCAAPMSTEMPGLRVYKNARSMNRYTRLWNVSCAPKCIVL